MISAVRPLDNLSPHRDKSVTNLDLRYMYVRVLGLLAAEVHCKYIVLTPTTVGDLSI